jgi:hypothetical protein
MNRDPSALDIFLALLAIAAIAAGLFAFGVCIGL